MGKVKTQIDCPMCGGKANITYEEDRLYKLLCPSCGFELLRKDKSWLDAQLFFEGINQHDAENDITEKNADSNDCETNCSNCIHERICDLWRQQECQSAACYVDDCFEPKNKAAGKDGKTADEMFRDRGYKKERDNEFQTIYKNGEDEIIFAKGRRVVFSITGSEEIAGFLYEDLPAICKLLEELEVE